MTILCPFCRHEMSTESNASNPDTLWRCAPCRCLVYRAAEKKVPEKDFTPIGDVKFKVMP